MLLIPKRLYEQLEKEYKINIQLVIKKLKNNLKEEREYLKITCNQLVIKKLKNNLRKRHK